MLGRSAKNGLASATETVRLSRQRKSGVVIRYALGQYGRRRSEGVGGYLELGTRGTLAEYLRLRPLHPWY